MEINTAFAARVITEALTLKAEIARLEAEFKNRTATLASLVGSQSGKHSVRSGNTTVYFTVSENNTYSQAVMLAALKPGQFQRVSERKLVNSQVKEKYPNIYAAAKTPNGVKVTL